MKTKIRTFIGLVALGIIGFTNLNATAGNSDLNSYVTLETEENLSIEAWMLNNELWMNRSEAKAETTKVAKALESESLMTEEEFFKAAESYTSSGSDKEIEKYATMQMNNSDAKAETEKSLEVEAWMTNEDFFKAAESYTASGSDNEVEKYATKLISLKDERKSK